MQGVGWFVAIIVGILAGWIAEKVHGRDDGLIKNLIVGLIGAVLGKFLATNLLDYAFEGFWQSLMVSSIGAIVFLWIWGLIRGRQAV